MDLEYMKVSLFEISYNKKIDFFTIFWGAPVYGPNINRYR